MDRNEEILQNLIKRVYHLEQEVIRLGGQPYKKEEALSQSALQQSEPQLRPQMSEPLRTVPQEEKQAPKKKEKGTFENIIGKSGMAILASILIFFSLVLFAGIAFSYMSDLAKVVIMYAISIAIAVFGIVKMSKINAGKEVKFKTFYTTLAACGIGAIYITDLVAYFGFKCIPLVLFIASLVIWIVITMFLTYKYSPIFAYICNIGFVIATVLTAVQFESSIIAFALYTICLVALYVMLRNENYNKDSFFFIQYPIVFVIVSTAVETNILSYVVFGALLLAAFVFANLVYRIEGKHIATNAVTMVFNVFAFIFISFEIEGNAAKFVVIALLLGIMAMYFVRYYKNNRVLFYITYVVTYFVSAILFFATDMYIPVALIPFILFLALGFVKKDGWFRAGGYFALVLSYLIQMDFYESWAIFVLYFVILLAAAFAVNLIYYTIVDKYIITAIMCYILADIINVFDLNICIAFVIWGVVAFITNTDMYRRNLATKEEEFSSKIIGYIISGLTIFSGLACSFSKSITPELYQVIVIMLIILALACVNTVKLYGLGIPDILVGFYICIKFSLWIYTVLHRLEAASYVVSIVGILVAILCIILGFKFRQKAYRLYGLVISMVSVVKLILFDISYDSNILRPVGFFVAGVLCFAISFIYSKLEKNMASGE